MNLHEKIAARLDELQAIAEASFGSPELSAEWTTHDGSGVHFGRDLIAWFTRTANITRYIVANDPATVLRGLAEDRDILARHHAGLTGCCRGCGADLFAHANRHGCAEILSLARRHGIEVDKTGPTCAYYDRDLTTNRPVRCILVAGHSGGHRLVFEVES